MNEQVTCADCKSECVPKPDSMGSGYATAPDGARVCYACVAEREKSIMRKEGKIALYLVKREDGHYAVNWPGTLEFKAHSVNTGRHNIVGTQTHFRFNFEGTEWSGAQYGGNNQVARCRQLRRARFN